MDNDPDYTPKGTPRPRLASQTFPIVKKVKYNPATKFTSLTQSEKPPKKLLKSPIKIPKTVNFRTPKQPTKVNPVHVNLMKRFNDSNNATKENMVQFPNGINLSDQSNLIIKTDHNGDRDHNSRVTIKNQSDTLDALIKRGISVTPSSSTQNGSNLLKLGSEITIKHISPVIEKWFKCSYCPGYFVKKLDLTNHEKQYHQQKTHDFGIPVVDLSKDESRDKLISLGIQHYMTITNMSQTEGCSSYGIPIVSVQGSANSTLCNILAMGADGILSVGSFKELHK